MAFEPSGELKIHIAETDTRAPKFGPHQIDLESTPSHKSPEDGESQGNEVFPGVSPKTRSILNGIAASHRANDRDDDLAPTIPANFGTHTIDTAANFLQRKQLVVTVPQFPNINGLEPWEAAICRGLIAATGSHDNRELPWFLEVMTKTHDELDDPSVEDIFMMLDAPLATALMKTLPTQLRNRVAQLESSALKRWKVVTGRQVAWMVLDWFKTDIHRSTFSSFEDINSLSWKGDSQSQMEKFLQDWDYLVENLGPNTMGPEALRDMSQSKWLNSTVLKDDTDHYKRARTQGPGVDADYSM